VPAVSGGLPRLSEVQAWDTQHLTTAAQRWADTATRWEGGFAEVVRQSFTPGGSAWEGSAATAAQGRAVADRTQVNRVAERLRTVAADARSGAAELSAARQRVLSAVDATRAAGFEVLNDLTVTYLDDGTSAATAAARRAQAESLAQDLWRRAADLAAIDRDVAQRITASSREIHSLSFGPGLGGPKDAPPSDVLGVRNAQAVHDVVDPLPPGKQPNVRELPTEAQIRALYDYLTHNSVPAPPSTYPGTERLLEDGTRISIRETSSSGGTTIDIRFPDQSTMKVHLPEDGEQPQPAPAPESGFWDTLGGIGIGILGGITWVGGKLVHPLG
jgi:hypothetical protein